MTAMNAYTYIPASAQVRSKDLQSIPDATESQARILWMEVHTTEVKPYCSTTVGTDSTTSPKSSAKRIPKY